MGRKFGQALDGGDKKLETSNSIVQLRHPFEKLQSECAEMPYE